MCVTYSILMDALLYKIYIYQPLALCFFFCPSPSLPLALSTSLPLSFAPLPSLSLPSLHPALPPPSLISPLPSLPPSPLSLLLPPQAGVAEGAALSPVLAPFQGGLGAPGPGLPGPSSGVRSSRSWPIPWCTWRRRTTGCPRRWGGRRGGGARGGGEQRLHC